MIFCIRRTHRIYSPPRMLQNYQNGSAKQTFFAEIICSKFKIKNISVAHDPQPAKSKSSPSRGAGVNAQHALHVWDSQEDSHNPSLQDSHSSPRVSIVFVSTLLHHFPLSTFFHEAPTIGPGSIE
ncbi:putative sucrose transporter [Erysiphe necator]|uniref:Putative sucrose transporter n=1 Tax=Uncinula necator TaxID=52586 RepID=A0A0B1P3U1_UNCNE|nr:putative sucrose transporter [Erysiphe necator]